MSASDYLEVALLDAVTNSTAYDNAGGMFVKLHIGDPGEAGTSNAAGETTRKQLTNAASVAGTFTSVNALTWTNVASTETISHVSVWDHVSAGNCLVSGALTASKAVTAGDTFDIAIGALTIAIA